MFRLLDESPDLDIHGYRYKQREGLCSRYLPGDIGRLPFEEVGHEHLVGMFLVRCGQDISALERLGEETKDVVDDEDGSLGIGWARDIWIFLGDGV